jgi:hypothetical protein
MLSVSALLQGKVPTQGSFISEGFRDKLVENLEITKTGIKKAILFLERERYERTSATLHIRLKRQGQNNENDPAEFNG